MEFTEELVDKYAHDLLIELSREENALVLKEFDIIKDNMEKINQIADLKEELPMTHPLNDYEIVLRKDEVKEELTTDEVLQNAKNVTSEEIIVPKVVE